MRVHHPSILDFADREMMTVERPQKRLKQGTFWRKDDPILTGAWPEVKLLRGGMWPHQRQWWNLPNFIKVMVGGYGAGKTLICCKRALTTALQNAPCPVAIVSPTFPLARKTIIHTMVGLLAGKQTKVDLWWRYNKQEHTFTIRHKGRTATIFVLSGDDPLSLRGPNLAAAYIDEPFIQSEDVFEQMIARVRHPDSTLKEIGLTGTPEQLNWGYDLCIGEMGDKLDVGYIQASTAGNLALDPQYIKNLRGKLSEKAFKAYVDGAFVNLSEGRVYYAFDALTDGKDAGNVVKMDPPKTEDGHLGCELGVGMDFNVNPMSATVFWRKNERMHFFDEIELPNADTEFMCSALRDKYGDKLQYVYPDATGSARKTAAPGGKSDFWYIKQAGFQIRAPHENPKRRDRYNAVNGKFKPANGKCTMTVDPRCKKLIKYLSVYNYEEMNKQEAMSHLLDAFSYPVSYLFPVNKDALTVAKLTGY